MASVRLTNSIRSEIQRKVVNRAFDELYTDLKKQEHDIAMAAYNTAFTKKDLKLMEALPKGWLPTKSHFNVKFDEGTLGHKGFKLGKNCEVLVPCDKNNYGVIAVIELGSPMEKLALKYFKDKADIDERYNEARSSVLAILDSVTTVIKLLKIWPEAKDFIVPYLNEYKCTLPAIQFKEVNKILGLPPKKD